MDCHGSRSGLFGIALSLGLGASGCAHQREVVYPPGSARVTPPLTRKSGHSPPTSRQVQVKPDPEQPEVGFLD